MKTHTSMLYTILCTCWFWFCCFISRKYIALYLLFFLKSEHCCYDHYLAFSLTNYLFFSFSFLTLSMLFSPQQLTPLLYFILSHPGGTPIFPFILLFFHCLNYCEVNLKPNTENDRAGPPVNGEPLCQS